jgi:hypothetical protein
MKTLIVSFVLASSIVGCIPNESPDGAGGSGVESSTQTSTGSINPGFGRSHVIDAFQSARRAALTDQAAIDAIDTQTASASMVDISPAAEEARIFHVLNWTIDGLESAVSQAAGVTFDHGSAPRSQEEAERTSRTFELAASELLYSLPEQKWGHEWTMYSSDFLDAQVAVDAPAQWEHIVYTATRGTLKCMRVIAIGASAESMSEANAALVGIRSQIAASADSEFSGLVSVGAN